MKPLLMLPPLFLHALCLEIAETIHVAIFTIKYKPAHIYILCLGFFSAFAKLVFMKLLNLMLPALHCH